MNKAPLVGIIGCNGAVGQQVIALLASQVSVRAGGRTRPVAPLQNVTYRRVDLFDDAALRLFCEGCTVVINCAAPGSATGDRVACAAAAQGADYLDPGGDDHLHALLLNKTLPARRYVLSAGMLPGLSGLMLRLAASCFDQLDEAQGFALSCEPFSSGAAADFLASLSNGYGVAGVVLRQGQLHPLAGGEAMLLPLARRRARAFPFMTQEWLRTGATCGAGNLSWHNLFADDELTEWFGQRDRHDACAAETLVALSVRAFSGQPSQHLLAVEARGTRRGNMQRCAWVIENGSGAQLTAAVTAFAAHQLLTGSIAPGLHFAADVLSPEETLGFIRRQLPDCTWLELPALSVSEEGAI